MKVGSKLYYCCKEVAMTLNLPLLYFVWAEEYCQTSPNKNKSPNLWHVTSISVCCIFDSYFSNICAFSRYWFRTACHRTALSWKYTPFQRISSQCGLCGFERVYWLNLGRSFYQNYVTTKLRITKICWGRNIYTNLTNWFLEIP